MSPESKKVVLITGVTGYIGSSVLCALLQLPNASSRFEFRAIIRSPEKAEKLKAFNNTIVPIIGSHSDTELMSRHASEADIVMSMAESDNVPVIETTLKGMKRRFEATGRKPVLIHTSGTGILNSDNAGGMRSTDIIYDDAKPEDIEALPPTNLHRPVDIRIVDADKDGYVNTYIIVPSTVYGIARNSLVEAGIANPRSMLFKALVPICLDRGEGMIIGEGRNTVPNIHIEEVVDIFQLVFNSIIQNPETTPHGREGYYFGASDEHTFYDMYKHLAEVLFELGKVKSPEPTQITDEEAEKYLGGLNGIVHLSLGSNGRCRCSRAKGLGWKPKFSNKDYLGMIREEVVAVLNAECRDFDHRKSLGKSTIVSWASI